MPNSRLPFGRSKRLVDELVNFIRSAPSLLNEDNNVTTGASATTANLAIYKASIITGGTAGNENYNLGNGTGAIVGQRKLVQLLTRTHASDVVVLDHANIALANGSNAAACSMNAANAFILFEWTGAKWKIIYTSASGVTAS